MEQPLERRGQQARSGVEMRSGPRTAPRLGGRARAQQTFPLVGETKRLKVGLKKKKKGNTSIRTA